MRAEGRRFEWMERISRPATRTGGRERGRRRRRESNKVTGASGFLRGKLLSPLRRLLRPRGESSDYDLPRSLLSLSLPSSAMKGKGSSSPRRFNVTAKDFTTRVKFQSALITFPRLLPRLLYRPDITTTAYCAFPHLASSQPFAPTHTSLPAGDSNNYYRTYVARIAGLRAHKDYS